LSTNQFDPDSISNPFGRYEYGFTPAKGYISMCHLCFEIRRYLVMEKGIKAKELQPRGFYEES